MLITGFRGHEPEDLTNKIAIARAAIVEHVRKTGNACGVIDCPACGKGKLKYSQAVGYNDHVHAMCLTLKCVWWAE